jgi:MFS family permease
MMSATPTAEIEAALDTPLAASAPAHWLTPQLVRVLAAASAWGFAFSTFYLLPKFLTETVAAGPAEIGLVVGTFGIATVLSTPLAGRCVDRFERRYAMVAGAILMAIAAAGFLLVRTIGPLVLVLRAMQGASWALLVTAIGTLVADLAPRERLGQALGLSGASMLVMNAIAPAIAEPLAALAGWQVVFALAAAAAVVSAALAAGVVEPPATVVPTRGGLLAVLRRPVAMHYALVIALAGMAFGAVFTFQQPFALALGRAQVGGFFIAYAGAAILVRVGFGHLPERVGLHRAALASLVLYALVVIAMAGLRPWMLEPLGALFGLAHGVFYPTMNAIALSAVDRDERGRIMAVFTGAFSLGMWAGATLLGLVAAHFGYPTVFVVAACGVTLAVAVLATSRALRGIEARPVDPTVEIADVEPL